MHVHPSDFDLTVPGVGEPVRAVADDAVDALHAGRREGVGELIGNGIHGPVSPSVATLGVSAAFPLRPATIPRRRAAAGSTRNKPSQRTLR